MKRIDVTDEWLYQHMPIVDEAMIKELEKEVDDTYQFSDKFEKKMKKTIQMEKRNSFINILYLKRKWVAVFVACIIGFGMFNMDSVQAMGRKFFEVTKTFFEDIGLVEYRYTGEESDVLYKVEPTYIPEGYVEAERIEDDSSCCIIYEDGQGEMIIWDQGIAVNRVLGMDTEYDRYEEIQLSNGSIVELHIYNDGSILSYCEYENSIFTCMTYTVDKQEVDKMIKSIEPVVAEGKVD